MDADARETPEKTDTLSLVSSLLSDVLGRPKRGEGRLKTFDMTVETVDREGLLMDSALAVEIWKLELFGVRALGGFRSGTK